MLERFKAFINQEKLFTLDHNILLAISGGVDSMVMADLFMRSGYTLAVAHLNHKMRGNASDEDARFVRAFAEERKLLYFEREVDFIKRIKNEKRNFQDLAREVRYKWFQEICQQNDLHRIATGHHKNDEIESFLFNFSRNSGFSSLSGIPVIRNNIVRPLLFASKQEILDYAHLNQVAHRSDSSNSETKYKRNFIRHLIIPKFESLNENFTDNASGSIKKLKEYRKLYSELIHQFKSKSIVKDKTLTSINLKDLNQYSTPTLLLYELIAEYGFNYDQANDMISSQKTGSQFYSMDYRANIDRNTLLVQSRKVIQSVNKKITESLDIVGLGLLDLNNITYPQQFESNANIAHFDKKLLQFPLTIRNWKSGDSFHPLGMQGTQKVKDFLTNNKIDRFRKEQTLVLCSGEQICWLVGHRMDDYFKLTESTDRVLRVEWKPY